MMKEGIRLMIIMNQLMKTVMIKVKLLAMPLK